MGEDEYSILQKKFREWFGKPDPVTKSLPDEVDHSIESPVAADLLLADKTDLQKKFREWFGKTVPDVEPLPNEVDHSIENSAETDLLLTDKIDQLNRGGKIVKRSSAKNKIIIDIPRGEGGFSFIRNNLGVILSIIFFGLVIGICVIFVPLMDILQSVIYSFLSL